MQVWKQTAEGQPVAMAKNYSVRAVQVHVKEGLSHPTEEQLECSRSANQVLCHLEGYHLLQNYHFANFYADQHIF